MELGKLNGRGQNSNVLHEAVHKSHGLVWTDGKAIFLAPVKILNGQVEPCESLKLGEFGDEDEFLESETVDLDEDDQSVKSIHWSSDVGPSLCYLCVVHPEHVSVWKVEGHVPKLSFKQVRKLNVQPIQQGCLWNPGRDILCVLSKQQCSFFFRHTQNRGSYAFPPIESGKIKCGAWSKDGSQLVLCVGAMLLIYTWPEIDVSISDLTPTAWRIPKLDGGVCSIVSLSNDAVVCAAELPLESLCKMQDTFITPDLNQNGSGLSPQSDIISPKGGSNSSLKDTLLNLPRHPGSLIEATSQLIVVQLRANKEPQTSCCTGVKGVLTPDILLYEENQQCIVVGSNNQSLLQVFAVDNSRTLVKVQEIQLNKDERPRGISSLDSPQLAGYQGILLAVGKRTTASALFPSSSESTGDVRLQFVPVSIDRSAMKVLAEENMTADQSMLENLVPSKTSTPAAQPQKKTIKLQYSVGEDDTQLDQSGGQSEPSSLEPFSLISNGISEASTQQKSQNESVDLLLKKQKTVSELRDYSDTDSAKSSPRETSQDSEELSPRETTPSTSTSQKKKIIVDLNESDTGDSDLETETTEFSEQKPHFKSPELDKYLEDNVGITDIPNLSKDCKETSPQCESKNTARKVSQSERDSGYTDAICDTSPELSVGEAKGRLKANMSIEDLEREIQSQNAHIEQLQTKVDSLSRIVEETSMVFPTKYQAMEKPDVVTVVCHCEGAKASKKTFLLDNKRLPLDVLKHAFGLSLVELYIDGESFVVGANIDGYIPVKFDPSSTVEVSGILQPASDKDSTSEDMGIGGIDKEVTC
ncbi:WD repeat and coiled-coil-containing protein-like isoform X2 [Mizuhopecten yessoensis]|uniref:WD repeat and coiled-coil-containing protein-like isoform X2 n=1 Tax=Mizuhopecten yessoensis TaxID=6573 RepID=UPI000B45DCC6|nr:WD repeat and coiled-coil-containing protein-like isoform X2 [Mizuhopecten yessoensis]